LSGKPRACCERAKSNKVELKQVSSEKPANCSKSRKSLHRGKNRKGVGRTQEGKGGGGGGAEKPGGRGTRWGKLSLGISDERRKVEKVVRSYGGKRGTGVKQEKKGSKRPVKIKKKDPEREGHKSRQTLWTEKGWDRLYQREKGGDRPTLCWNSTTSNAVPWKGAESTKRSGYHYLH